jgi:hypothetical protein
MYFKITDGYTRGRKFKIMANFEQRSSLRFKKNLRVPYVICIFSNKFCRKIIHPYE